MSRSAPVERGWRAGHRLLLAGACVATLAAVAAGVVSRLAGGAAARLPNETMIRGVIEAADAAAIHAAWRSMSRAGVDRGAMPEELEVQRAAGSLGRVAAFLWGLAAVAGLAAGGGGLACLATRSPPTPGGSR